MPRSILQRQQQRLSSNTVDDQEDKQDDCKGSHVQNLNMKKTNRKPLAREVSKTNSVKTTIL